MAERVRQHTDGGEGDGHGALPRPDRRLHIQEDVADSLLEVVRAARLRRHLAAIVQVRTMDNDKKMPSQMNFRDLKYLFGF